MTRRLRISAEAEAEAANASRWYEKRRLGLGNDFLRAVDSAITRITRTRNVRPFPASRIRRSVAFALRGSRTTWCTSSCEIGLKCWLSRIIGDIRRIGWIVSESDATLAIAVLRPAREQPAAEKSPSAGATIAA